jgi:multidrug efflux system membrane fusion protein
MRIVPLLFVALATAACSSGGAATDTPAGGYAAGPGGPPPVPVTTAAVVVKTMPVNVRANGTVQAASVVEIRAQVTGALTDVHFTEGQDVRANQPLFTLDSRPFEAAVKQAQANLARNTAQQTNAKADLARATDLFAKGLIPRSQFDLATTAAAALDATVAADTAQVENAKLQMQYTKIAAPMDGRTGALMAHAGDLVRANDTTPLVVIQRVTPIDVSFSVPARQLPDVRRYHAQRPLAVEARIAGSADGAVHGTLDFIDSAVDPSTGTIRLKGRFTNADRRLWPGSFVDVTLQLTTDPKALVVPAHAVQTGQQGPYVYLVKADKTVEMRQVTVARSEDGQAIIERGLQAGDEVVADGHLRLTPGARIVLKPAADAPQQP